MRESSEPKHLLFCGVHTASGPAFQWPPVVRDPLLSQLLAGAPSGPGGWLRCRPSDLSRTSPAGAAPRPAFL